MTDSAEPELQPAAAGNPTRRDEVPKPAYGVTEREVEAVFAVMRTLRDEQPPRDRERQILCHGCRRLRPSRGSVAYGAHLVCNGCATDYELLRIARTVESIEQFLDRRTRPSVGRGGQRGARGAD